MTWEEFGADAVRIKDSAESFRKWTPERGRSYSNDQRGHSEKFVLMILIARFLVLFIPLSN